jgi:hypothetical protein
VLRSLVLGFISLSSELVFGFTLSPRLHSFCLISLQVLCFPSVSVDFSLFDYLAMSFESQ